ncbi:hypothetical protein niasHS_003993 [Heterodera schachtii]|uniref:SET domain-containing protein n=1 Tax=Heterodera schachtii TaxID=97005 RepID=A0ABD2K3S6_HETSC
MVNSLSGPDISNGFAAVPIPWVNDVDNFELAKFDYSPLPKFAENLPNRVFCNCKGTGGCSAQKGCACVEMSTIELSEPGRVHNAHLLNENAFESRFFECSSLCSCAGTCANRLAPQNDAQRNHLQIFKTLKAGFGCRTLKPIRKGSFICFLGGEVFPFDYPSKKAEEFKQIVDADKVCFTFSDKVRQFAFFVRFDRFANESRFFNSACCPNLRLVHLFRNWLSPDRPLLAFVAISEIGVGEELTHYYGDRWFLDKLSVRPKCVCRCASPFCVWPPKANRRDDFFSRPKDRQLKANKVRAELRQRRSGQEEETKKKRNKEEKEKMEG